VPFTRAWWSPPVFFPLQGTLAFSEHLAGLGVISTPVQLAGGNALLAYNIAFVASFALSAWCAYLLTWRLTGSRVAAACAGLAFGFGPYRAGQLAHLQVLTAQWMPLILLSLHEYVRTSRRAWLAAFGASWVVQALSNGYYLLFLPVLIACWVSWFVDWRRSSGRGVAIVVTWVIASVPLIPVLVEYRGVHAALDLARTPAETARFSATPASFLHAAPLLAVWPTSDVATQEDYLFPGLTGILVVTVAWVVVRSRADYTNASTLAFYSLAAVLMYALALGPGAGTSLLDWLRPYRWATLLPGYAGLRAPARFAMLASLCLSTAAGVAIATLLANLRGLRRLVTAAVIVAGLVLDGVTVSLPLAPPPPRFIVPADMGNALVLELPPDDARVSVAAMYRAMFHRLPLVNGYSGYIPPHYAILSIALRRGDPSPLMYFARNRPLLVVVNDRPDSGAGFRSLVEGLPGVTALGGSGAGMMFKVPPQPRIAPLDGRFVRAEATLNGRTLTLDLGQARVVRGIEFLVRWRYEELGERMAVEYSNDAVGWQRAWLDWTGEPVLDAAMRDPLRVPVRLPLKDVSARYLRVYPAPHWLPRELQVLVP
jgi:hypothetical protein